MSLLSFSAGYHSGEVHFWTSRHNISLNNIKLLTWILLSTAPLTLNQELPSWLPTYSRSIFMEAGTYTFYPLDADLKATFEHYY